MRWNAGCGERWKPATLDGRVDMLATAWKGISATYFAVVMIILIILKLFREN